VTATSAERTGGTGGPENANIAGLQAPYIVQQLADFKSGARKNPVAKRGPTELKASDELFAGSA
jgi:cytochrome c553